jgi:phage gp46-like protein
MSDIALQWSEIEHAADVAIELNDLVQDGGLETAVMLSLFTDRQAEVGDVLPDGETDRRGWWADAAPVVEGDRIGSRLWLLAREVESQAVLDRAVTYAREALQWLLDDKVAERVEVTAEIPRRGMLGLVVEIFRPQQDVVRYRFRHVWTAQEANV